MFTISRSPEPVSEEEGIDTEDDGYLPKHRKRRSCVKCWRSDEITASVEKECGWMLPDSSQAPVRKVTCGAKSTPQYSRKAEI